MYSETSFDVFYIYSIFSLVPYKNHKLRVTHIYIL